MKVLFFILLTFMATMFSMQATASNAELLNLEAPPVTLHMTDAEEAISLKVFEVSLEPAELLINRRQYSTKYIVAVIENTALASVIEEVGWQTQYTF